MGLNLGTGIAGGGPQPQQDPNEDVNDLAEKWKGQQDFIPDQDSGTVQGAPPKKTDKSQGKSGAKQAEGGGDIYTDKEEQTGPPLTEAQIKMAQDAQKASGSNYATLSQFELDSVKSDQPLLLGQKSTIAFAANQGAPPPGPKGTGNPFFNVNPLVSFFIAFAAINMLMGFVIQVAGKLAAQDMVVQNELGHDQANADLQQGKAEAAGEEAQATSSLVMGILGAGSAFMGLGALFRARRAFNAEKNALKEETLAKDTNFSTKMEENSSKIEEQEIKVAAKKNQLSKHKEVSEEEEEDFDRATVTGQKGLAKKLRQEKKEMKEKAEETWEVAKEKTVDSFNKLKAKMRGDQAHVKLKEEEEDDAEFSLEKDEQASSARQSELKSKYRDEEEDNWNKKLVKNGETDEKFEKTVKEYEQELKTEQAELTKLKSQQRKLKAKKEANLAKYKSFKAGKMSHIGQAMQSDPWYMTWQSLGGPQGTAGMMMQWYSHNQQAQADLEAAYWKAQGTLFGTYQNIVGKGTDSAIQMQQQAVQQGSDAAKTLGDMAQQETTIGKWTVA